jgi:hypothetical protein
MRLFPADSSRTIQFFSFVASLRFSGCNRSYQQ